MATIVKYIFFVVLVASCFAAPGHTGDRGRRHDSGVGGYGGLPGFVHHGYGGYPGGHVGSHISGSQSFSKSSASASSSSHSGGGHIHG